MEGVARHPQIRGIHWKTRVKQEKKDRKKCLVGTFMCRYVNGREIANKI